MFGQKQYENAICIGFLAWIKNSLPLCKIEHCYYSYHYYYYYCCGCYCCCCWTNYYNTQWCIFLCNNVMDTYEFQKNSWWFGQMDTPFHHLPSIPTTLILWTISVKPYKYAYHVWSNRKYLPIPRLLRETEFHFKLKDSFEHQNSHLLWPGLVII